MIIKIKCHIDLRSSGFSTKSIKRLIIIKKLTSLHYEKHKIVRDSK
jgi:uncharacterized protein (UPF0335 family)